MTVPCKKISFFHLWLKNQDVSTGGTYDSQLCYKLYLIIKIHLFENSTLKIEKDCYKVRRQGA